ncbi:asparagine synthase (glutamine-hydrolyzing) [Ruminococcus flavefaciens]|uniref:asparagine synthase (glutamine-hydrolyzing) n=1 Tax=Ruminococcus flavefaciens TaxID=1265 RepID=A0A315XWB7_RUMFL|nr:asparagine synthase (glutamine-hydrolyzing) [Ruminococcus flavefaciens]PWJ11504.1 asparagine synthase (glutamine-hydrolysing) [Ruminococcus flavefaciens]SSA50413.1 asparagine synthase (glutamine-hydrolysing) [Ruminococcus flavefaciens]
MCGIAGAVSFIEDMREDMKIYEKMQHALLRRGPDQRGMVLKRQAALIHTRLAVIDIDGGRQPMSFGRYTIVYNGELYNTEELRRELAGDFDFTTHSDTEVVLKSYIKWGSTCVDRFNGIFALAVWDEEEQRLFLARDRIGVKPLFYYDTGTRLIFASELPSLLEHPLVPHEIDAVGAAELLLMAPGRTMGCGVIRGVKEVKPGWCGYYTAEGTKLWEYWRLRAYELHESFEDTAEHVRELVLDSVRRQLVSDVPVCTFLSGGLDSSLISSVAAAELKKQGRQLTTLSVDYRNNEKYFCSSHFQPDSDPEYIACMAEYLGTDHHNIVLDTADLAKALDDAVEARGLPGMADVDSSMLLFCREIKKYGTVALSGECADEIFGGYPWYRDENTRMTDGFPWAQSTAYRSRFLCDRYAREIDAVDYVYSAYRRTADYAMKLPDDSPLEYRMREMTQLNFHWFMQTLLDRKDRMSMYSGLEVRVPFCDYRIAEYLYNVPWEYKDYKGREKGLLREAMKDWLPEKVLWRKKSPYPKTHDPVFLDIVTERLRSVLDSGGRLTELVKREELERLLRHEDHVQWYGQLMNLPQTIAYFLQLNCWLERFDIKLV